MHARGREEHMLPAALLAAASTVEQHHLVAAKVCVKQASRVDLVELQLGVAALEYEGLTDGIGFGHGIDTSEQLLVEIRGQAVLAQQVQDDGVEVKVFEKSALVDLTLAEIANRSRELHQ
ncbi:hypothetical protein SDC9_129105 [bioreactor metagenome]|uniref:Uncharacterized protein n=1 Tax=bioreactor metagenome TaxID=1076179 RepID=A0A645CYQ2_9ZZZZ